MKKIFLSLILFILSVTTLSLYQSCQKIPNGFLTSYPYYDQNPMTITQGRSFVSSPLETIGSTIPMQVKILHVYDAAGNNVDSIILKHYPTYVFKGYWDPIVDTTVVSINSIMESIDTLSINVNSENGSFEANGNTLLLPPGSYSFDLQISNSAGTKIYPKIATFILQPGKPYQDNTDLGATSDGLHQAGNENKTFTAKAPLESIQYVADTPNVVEVKYVDKNGVPFNPKNGEIVNRPYASSPTGYLPNLQTAALRPIVTTDSSFLLSYGVVPFPLHTLEEGYNYYVRIPAQFVHFDDAPDTVQWSGNPRWIGRFWVYGKYEVTIQLPDAVHL